MYNELVPDVDYSAASFKIIEKHYLEFCTRKFTKLTCWTWKHFCIFLRVFEWKESRCCFRFPFVNSCKKCSYGTGLQSINIVWSQWNYSWFSERTLAIEYVRNSSGAHVPERAFPELADYDFWVAKRKGRIIGYSGLAISWGIIVHNGTIHSDYREDVCVILFQFF